MRRICFVCARAASGHVTAAAPHSSPMNSRRFMLVSPSRDAASGARPRRRSGLCMRPLLSDPRISASGAPPKLIGRYGALLPLFRLVGALCIAALWRVKSLLRHRSDRPKLTHRSFDLEIHRRCFPAVLFDLILDVLPFIESAPSSALDRGDVDEYVFAACLRLNKSVTLRRIEPFHGAARHFDLPSDDLG